VKTKYNISHESSYFAIEIRTLVFKTIINCIHITTEDPGKSENITHDCELLDTHTFYLSVCLFLDMNGDKFILSCQKGTV
jgi:hypothetical protein